MSNKKFAISTAIVLFLIVSVGFSAQIILAHEGINPVGAITAVTVAVIGIAWFKKTVKPAV
jgi:hypothetical protein